MPNSHRPPDTTRRSCLCRARRCELSLETVWQSLKSQPIDHTAVHSVLTFSWRTTSLRGVAARRSCLPGLRRGGGGRQAGATVLSCLVRTDRPTSAFCVGVRPAVALRRPTYSDTNQTQNAPVWLSGRLNSHCHTRHDKTVLSVTCPV